MRGKRLSVQEQVMVGLALATVVVVSLWGLTNRFPDRLSGGAAYHVHERGS